MNALQDTLSIWRALKIVFPSYTVYKENSNLVSISKFDNWGGGVYNISNIVENYVLGITQQMGGVGT